jgi:glycosyltransferase involved in cell wall biosynthesis
MTFSVVMPSYLGPYKGAAKDRNKKIIRAIESVRSQTFEDWELIVVADGCRDTLNLINENYAADNRISCLLIEKQPLWSGVPRNVGAHHARGEWITYLDIDDMFGRDHLAKIALGIDAYGPGFDWVFYNDHITLAERKCTPAKGHCGTSNVTFRRSLGVQWKDASYLHDWKFIQELLRFPYIRIPTPEYHVMHIPKRVDL